MEAINGFISSELGIVFAIYFLYLVDVVSRRKTEELGVSLTIPCRYYYPSYRLKVFGKTVTAERLFQPWSLVVTEPVLPLSPTTPKQSQLRQIRVIRANLMPAVILSCFNGALLLCAFPYMTVSFGLFAAIKYLALPIYINSLFLLIFAFSSPFKKRISIKQKIEFVSDLLLCPPFSVNAAQKLLTFIHPDMNLRSFIDDSTRTTRRTEPIEEISDYLLYDVGLPKNSPEIIMLAELSSNIRQD